jgi:hypothetical protein
VPREGRGRQSRPPPLPPSARRAATEEARVEAADPETAAVEPEIAANASASCPPPAQSGAAPGSVPPRSLSSHASTPAPAGTGDEARRSLRSKRPPKPDQPRRSPAVGPAGEQTAATGESPPKPAAGAPDWANALRVGLKPSSRDERLLVVRLLGPGEEPAPGYRPALVVMLDSAGNGVASAK